MLAARDCGACDGMTTFSIRRGRPGDEAAILALLTELADYEKLLDKFHITAEIIRRDYLSARPLCHCDLALEGDTPVGVASWYWTYASFAAARGLYLEDLFVRPVARGKGYGKALLAHLAKTAVAAGAVRVDWSVLDWNKPSIEFYDSLGARPHDGWLDYRLEGAALAKLGGG
jgi:diamine N-acetyltransferase